MRLTWIGMLLLITGIAQAQVKTIQGLVLDETDQPLTGATVYTSDKKSSAITDLDGLFKLTNVNVGDTLVVSYVSYQTFKQVIKSSDNFFRVALAPDERMLDEVVIVGYGQQKKSISCRCYCTSFHKGTYAKSGIKCFECTCGKTARHDYSTALR